MLRSIRPLALIALLGLLSPGALAQTSSTTIGGAGHLQFNLTYDTSIDPNALSGFEEAAGRWSNLFSDPITINLTIGFQSLPSNIIGETSSAEESKTYTQVHAALIADAKSADDLTAVSHLQASPATQFLVNYTAQNGDSATPYLDNNVNFDNLNIGLTFADEKALGLRSAGTENDATIIFTSNTSTAVFDFNPDDGITAGENDFVGAATHEIGHAMGFISSTDDVSDGSPGSGGTPVNENSFDPDTLDLFRYSTLSTADGGFDITADTRTKYFSLDGGATQVSSNALFSDGLFNGDGHQASHWEDNIGAGIMDPTEAPGETLQISSNDIRMFDAIGYDLAAAPEPSSLSVMALGSLGVLGCLVFRRRRVL